MEAEKLRFAVKARRHRKLGTVKPLSAITSWSFNQNDNRVRQFIALYGSQADATPGWDVTDRSRWVALGKLDTASLPIADFHVATLRFQPGKKLFHAPAFRHPDQDLPPIVIREKMERWVHVG